MVFMLGCNDEGALGRTMEDEEEECCVPGLVDLPSKVRQVSAGDSHTAALTEDGHVYIWGTFRDSSGSFGLTPDGQIQKLPVMLPLPGNREVIKISSGSDHLAMLTTGGELYTVGCGEQGQLGRVAERFAARGGRRGLELLLLPDRVHAKNRRTVFADVWAGSYDTLALSTDNEVLVCGLNNYNQVLN
jgi:regulator of chromosome condensation